MKPSKRLSELEKAMSWQKKQRIWRHNGLIGSARMMESNCRSILNNTETVTPEAKVIALKIFTLAGDLANALRKRIDSPVAEPARPRPKGRQDSGSSQGKQGSPADET